MGFGCAFPMQAYFLSLDTGEGLCPAPNDVTEFHDPPWEALTIFGEWVMGWVGEMLSGMGG